MTATNDIFTGIDFIDDAEIRRRGIGFIDGSIPGYALLIGKTADPVLLEDLTRRRILTFVDDDALSAELHAVGQPLGWDSGVVPLNLSKAMDFIIRVAQTFGNADSPDSALEYALQRLRGFTLLSGPPTPDDLKKGQTALRLGCPLISTAELPSIVDDWEIPTECRPTLDGVSLSDLVQIGIEERGLQVSVPFPGLPVAYSSDFSGQAVQEEVCGACLTGVELVVTRDNIVDGRVTLNGSDLDDAIDGDQPFAMLVEVSGKAMLPDFESVLERQIETILNDSDGKSPLPKDCVSII